MSSDQIIEHARTLEQEVKRLRIERDRYRSSLVVIDDMIGLGSDDPDKIQDIIKTALKP